MQLMSTSSRNAKPLSIPAKEPATAEREPARQSPPQKDPFEAYVDALTEQTILEPEVFAAVLETGSDFLTAQRLEKVRQKAKVLGISRKTVDSMFSAFKRGLTQHVKETRLHEEWAARINRDFPDWYLNGAVDEPAFVTQYALEHALVCVNGQLYGAEGKVTDDEILSDVQKALSPYVSSQIARKSADLLKALKNHAYMEPPKPEADRIYTQNGCLLLDGSFSAAHPFTLYRLPIEYDPKAGRPAKWEQYVHELLEPEDAMTLQEYMGYCMVPSTKAQKMLFLIGSGGEGKSVIGSVMKDIFGPCMVTGSLHDLDENRFALAALENELVFVDDELSTNGCRESKSQKTIVTAAAPVRVEIKGRQSYEAEIRCRLLAFGNVPFTTLYDHSEGAYRRRIIINTRPKPPDRKDNRNLSDELKQERQAIFLWMFQGLQRLAANGWEFTLSEAAKSATEEAKRDSFNLLDFLEDGDYIALGDPDEEAASVDIYAAYRDWCRENAETPLAQRTVLRYMKENSQRLKICPSYHVTARDGGRVRGFKGVEIKRIVDLSCYSEAPL